MRGDANLRLSKARAKQVMTYVYLHGSGVLTEIKLPDRRRGMMLPAKAAMVTQSIQFLTGLEARTWVYALPRRNECRATETLAETLHVPRKAWRMCFN